MSAERARTRPLFARVADAIRDDIRRGRFVGGDLLPSSRALAAQLGVHRNTILAAYAGLESEGWLFTEAARGTFVAKDLPVLRPRPFAERKRSSPIAKAPFPLREDTALPTMPEPLPKGALSLRGGQPDVRLTPRSFLARAVRREMMRKDGLAYGDPRGAASLRKAIASMLSALRALVISPAHVLVTRGSQMAIDLFARALLSPGDVVVVEEYGFRAAWDALRATGATLVAVPVDDDGLDVSALARLLRSRRVRAVYVTPHHQYPTMKTLSASRRIALLELATTYGFAILEDDYDHEFHFEGQPVLPLASADVTGSVVYVGTLSKVLAPGLRAGYLVGPEELVERCARIRVAVDRQGDLPQERALANLLDDGDIARHVRATRRVYAERRTQLANRLRERFGSFLDVTPAPGGLSFWCKVHTHRDAEELAARARQANVVLYAGGRFALDGKPRPYLRIGFAELDATELRTAVERLARVWF